MNKLSIYRCSLFISLYVRYYLVSKYSKNFEQYWNDTQVFMCLLLHYKFRSVPSGRPLNLTAENIDPPNRNLLCPFIIAVDIYYLPTTCLHINNTPYDCIVQYRAEEQRSPITIVIVPASGEAISAVTVRRKEAGKTAGISLSLSRYCISRLIIV